MTDEQQTTDPFAKLGEMFSRVANDGRKAREALTARRCLEAEVLRDFALLLEQTELDEAPTPASAAIGRGVLLSVVETARSMAQEVDGKGITTLRDAARALRDAAPAER